MPRLWLAQVLCPTRHAICALAYDREETPAAEIERRLRGAFAPGALNPWCGLCGSRELHIEHGKLFTDDWTVAETALRAGEQAQRATRDFLERSTCRN
jgi:hypothetical protein